MSENFQKAKREKIKIKNERREKMEKGGKDEEINNKLGEIINLSQGKCKGILVLVSSYMIII